MKKKAHYAPKQQEKRAKKAQIEKMSNHLLMVFAVALVAEIVLLFLYTAFKSTETVLGMPTFMMICFFVFLAAFIGMLIAARVLGKKGKTKAGKKLANWSFVALSCGVVSLLLRPNWLFTPVFNLLGADPSSLYAITNWVAGAKGCLIFMALVALYVLVYFIITNIKMKKIEKSYK